MICHDALPSRSEYVVCDEEALRKLLDSYQISYANWGLEGTKRLEDLLAEVAEGEAILEDRNGKLTRVVDGVAVNVYAEIDGAHYRLREDRQVFVCDGTVKRRNLSTSLGEKIKRDETHTQAIIRALREELGVTVGEAGVVIGDSMREVEASRVYPGIVSDRGLTMAAVILPRDQVRREGYVEHQPQKDNFFVWQLLS